MVRVGLGRHGGGGGPRAGGLAARVPARPPPRAVALPHLQRGARGLAAPRLQPARAVSRGAAAGDGARRGAVRGGVPGGRAGRLAGGVGAGPRRVPGGRVGRRVRAAGRAPRQRAAQLPRHALRRRAARGRARGRLLRRRLCRARQIHQGGAAGVLRGARGGRAGGADDRAAGAEARAAAAVGAAAVVGGAGRVRGVHAVRRALQHLQRARGRAALHAARPAARRRLLTDRPPEPSDRLVLGFRRVKWIRPFRPHGSRALDASDFIYTRSLVVFCTRRECSRLLCFVCESNMFKLKPEPLSLRKRCVPTTKRLVNFLSVIRYK